jgi:1-deoxy-D-xylulose-5-phosphate synthase
LGLKSGDDLSGESDRHSVAVIGDGAFPSGIVFEALNNIGGLKKKTIVVLNDNKMSICPRVGGVAEFLDRLRISPAYTSLKGEVQKFLENLPVIGEPMERWLGQAKDSFKAGLHHGGMLFEDLGMRYVGPIDGHNLGNLQKLLRLAKDADVPVLLHVVTEKGHGFQPAAADPVFFHTPAPFDCDEECVVSIKQQPSRAYTNAVSEAIYTHLQRNPRASVITAAMCQGNNLEKVRADFPDQFFDTGICESHAVAFAAGQAKAGCRPIVDIYSTFLQRSYDQIFQEVALQNLPVTFLLDRAGLTGPDGPTHHGVFDLGYMRLFPNMVVMAPGDELDIVPMLDFAMTQSSPTSLRYPKAKVESVPRNPQPVELGKAEVLEWGHDGMILACGTQLPSCVKAMQQLRGEGYDIGVINARFVKPLDTEVILRALRTASFVITVEEGALMGGFGSAVLEAACDAGLTTQHLRRLGIPDRFIEHGERNELLAELGLDTAGIVSACRAMADGVGVLKSEQNFNAAGAARSA